jgi:hypothetical protein
MSKLYKHFTFSVAATAIISTAGLMGVLMYNLLSIDGKVDQLPENISDELTKNTLPENATLSETPETILTSLDDIKLPSEDSKLPSEDSVYSGPAFPF